MHLPWAKNTFALYKVLIAFALVSLVFTFTNVVPISATLSLFILTVPILLVSNASIPKVTFSTLLLFTYFIIHTLFYTPETLLEFGYYRRDGNFLITIAPLLILSLTKMDLNLKSIVRTFIVATSAVNILFMLIFMATGTTILFQEDGIYHFLFEAHNAAGGFLSMLCCFSYSYYLATKNKFILFLFFTNLLGLWLTNSRGSVAAFALAFIMVVFLKNRFNKLILILMIAVQIPIFSFLYHYAPDDYITADEYNVNGADESMVEREGTVVIRTAYLWPKAVYMFLQSPIFGTGFGSFNDNYNEFNDNPLFHFIKPTAVINSANHAHHTFLHVMAETGLVGLFLVGYWLYTINQLIWKLPFPEVSVGLKIAFWISIVSSFSEHRLFTSSQMTPFIIILGLSLAKYRHIKSVYNSKQVVP